MNACAKSWGTLAAGWWFCSLPAGHDGPCSCAGRAKPDDALYFEQQPEAIAALRRQVEREPAAASANATEPRLALDEAHNRPGAEAQKDK